ncbi:MAG: hypothetical protein K9M80_09650 [Candidatus Marinimicrobia bacterium]|nr:hypothetical protein [Candidatus Neomarinimicrobiota bacterium]
MLCLSITESYLRYFLISNGKINSIGRIDLGDKLDLKNKTADKFYNDLSAVFSILSDQNSNLAKNLAIAIPSQWADFSIYKIDPDLTEKDKLEYFEWKNSQKFGAKSTQNTYQYYPLESTSYENYLAIAYPTQLKNCLIKSALGNNFTVDFIDIDIFSVLNSVQYSELNNNLDSYAIWSASDNQNHAILTIKNGVVSNYIEINPSLPNNTIVKNALPLEQNLIDELKNIYNNDAGQSDLFSKIFMFSHNNTEFIQNVTQSSKNIIQVPNVLKIINAYDLDLASQGKSINTTASEYLDVLGLFIRGVNPK